MIYNEETKGFGRKLSEIRSDLKSSEQFIFDFLRSFSGNFSDLYSSIIPSIERQRERVRPLFQLDEVCRKLSHIAISLVEKEDFKKAADASAIMDQSWLDLKSLDVPDAMKMKAMAQAGQEVGEYHAYVSFYNRLYYGTPINIKEMFPEVLGLTHQQKLSGFVDAISEVGKSIVNKLRTKKISKTGKAVALSLEDLEEEIRIRQEYLNLCEEATSFIEMIVMSPRYLIDNNRGVKFEKTLKDAAFGTSKLIEEKIIPSIDLLLHEYSLRVSFERK